MPGYQWVSTEARTGKIIADLPLLSVATVAQSVNQYETANATLPITPGDAPTDWRRATKKGATHLILLRDNPNDPAHGIPVAGFMINRRPRDHTDILRLDLATVEAYFDRVYVGDEVYAGVGQNAIVSDLVTKYAKDGAKQGIPIRVQILDGPGTPRDREYKDTDDKTLYSILSDLSGVMGGPEWYIGWEWQTAPERITPVLYVGTQVGRRVPAGLGPAATFEMPGAISAIELLEDYGRGRGATDVMAVSSGQGDIRPQSAHQVMIDPDQPRTEHRFTPSTSITDVATLNEHALAAVMVMHHGATSLSMTAVTGEGPQLGVDWNLGDEVGFVIGDGVPAFPDGLEGIARVVGFELSPGEVEKVTPILVSPTGAFDA